MRQALALTHVSFEGLGLLGPILDARGFQTTILNVPQITGPLDLISPDLVVILGGPIGVYQSDLYPFLEAEIEAIRARLLTGRATLGLCLGAQLMARACGAAVYPGPEREIGYKPLRLTDAGWTSPLSRLDHGVPVLHWHGDTFDLPEGAEHLASTGACENQAFSMGPKILGLQFHLEVGPHDLEAWLVGHAVELSNAQIDPRDLRAQAQRAEQRLKPAATAIFSDWLHQAGF
jgi:GMP synthase (glutamine-hydrolysing)